MTTTWFNFKTLGLFFILLGPGVSKRNSWDVKEKSPGKHIVRVSSRSLLCLSQPSAPFLRTCGSKFSEHSHFRCWFKRSPSPTPQKSVSLGQGPRICLWQASPGDSNSGELDCSLRNTPLKISSSSSAHMNDTDLKHPAFCYKYESSGRWSPQARNPFSPLALSRPATREIISLRDVIDIESCSDLVITSVFNKTKQNKAQQYIHLTQRFPTHFIFADHWFVAFEDQHLSV